MAKAKQQAKGSKPSYMTTYEAADFLGFTAGTLRVWRSQGKGPNYGLLFRMSFSRLT